MQYYIEQIIEAATALSCLEILAVICGLVYVILAAKEKIWCWFWGILNAIFSVYLFYTYGLYAESILYIYYVFAGFYGWLSWRNHNKIETLKISTWKIIEHIFAIILGILLALVLAYLLKNYTSAKLPLIDSFTTIFSFIATFMVTRKVLENWIYWILIDLVTIGLYFNRALYLYALLMLGYTIIAIIGYYKWKAIYNKEKTQSIETNTLGFRK